MSGAGEQTTTREERFFGVRHELDMNPAKPEKKPEVEPPLVVLEDDEPTATPAAAPKPEAKKDDVPDDFEPDFGDDFDPELKKHLSDKVRKRISHLTWEREQAKREQEAARREREEAVNFARSAMQNNQRLQSTINNGEAYLVGQMKQAAELAVKNAEQTYREAYEKGDTDAIIAAQREIIKAQSQQEYAENYSADYERRKQQAAAFAQRPQMQPHAPAQQPVSQLTERQKKWGSENPWFHHPKHKRMTSFAYGVHEELVTDEGLNPNSDAYFQRMDEEMRKMFPSYFDEGDGDGAPTGSEPRRQSSTVVAPASRTPTGGRMVVKLSRSERAVADRLGVSYEDYAAQKLNGMKS